MLLDSNIIIYATQPEHDRIRKFIAENTPAVSSISYVEVLGYHRLTDQDRHYFERFFQLAQVLSISDSVLKQAVLLRQQRKMTLGDSIYCWNCVGLRIGVDYKEYYRFPVDSTFGVNQSF